MKLIVEKIETVETLTEEVNGKKNFYIEGIFLQAECKNRNGRVYPKSVMEQAVEKYIKERINTDSAYGELAHPDSPKINLDRASHLIKELKWEGNNVYGKAIVMSTPMGGIVRGIVESGGKLGVSSRGMGSLKESNGVNIVQNDFILATAADVVDNPSAPDAFVNGIMEGVEYFWDSVSGTLIEERIDTMKKDIHKMSKSQLEEAKIMMFEQFLQELTKQHK